MLESMQHMDNVNINVFVHCIEETIDHQSYKF